MIPGFGVLLALLSSLLLSLGGWLQWRGLRRLDGGFAPMRLLREPSWGAGILASAIGTIAYHGSILLAPLTLVQPLSSLHVAFTALLSWRGRRVNVREWFALALCAAGTLVLALSDRPPAAAETCRWGAFWIVCICGAAPLLLPFPRRLAGSCFALRAGFCYGLSAILWKAGMELPVPSPGWGCVMVLFAAGFLGGFAFLQAAFRRVDAGTANALAASIAALFPIPAGLWAFGEAVDGWMLLATVGTLLGVALLGRAPRAQESELAEVA